MTKNNPDTSVYDGTKSKNDSILSGANNWMVRTLAPRVPAWIETYHLTAMTYFWAALCVASGYVAQWHHAWMWGMVIGIFGHYVTDALDGEVGRRRGTGLIRWGFYTDHFGDHLFLLGIVLGLSYVTPANMFRWIMVMGGLWSTFFLNAYLIWIIKKQYTLSFFRFSSIEAQFLLMFIVMAVAVWGPSILDPILRIINTLSVVGLTLVFFRAQRQLWLKDKNNRPLDDL